MSAADTLLAALRARDTGRVLEALAAYLKTPEGRMYRAAMAGIWRRPGKQEKP